MNPGKVYDMIYLKKEMHVGIYLYDINKTDILSQTILFESHAVVANVLCINVLYNNITSSSFSVNLPIALNIS